jgi:hypothetical protein
VTREVVRSVAFHCASYQLMFKKSSNFPLENNQNLDGKSIMIGLCLTLLARSKEVTAKQAFAKVRNSTTINAIVTLKK